MFLRRLKATLNIPVLAFVDADPHGLKILSVYSNGSKNMVSLMVVPLYYVVPWYNPTPHTARLSPFDAATSMLLPSCPRTPHSTAPASPLTAHRSLLATPDSQPPNPEL